MEQTTIRELGPDDYDVLMALWQRAGLHSIRPQGRDSRAAFEQQCSSGLQKVLGLELDGQLIGVVLTTHDGRKGWINRLAIAPGYRRRGYAAQLVAAAESVLHEQGMQVIAALIETDNGVSFEMFQKLGYVELPGGIHYVSKRPDPEA